MSKSATKKIAIIGGIAVTVMGLGVLVLLLLARNPERRVAKLLQEAQIHKRTNRLDKEADVLTEALAVMPRDAGLMAKLARNLAARSEMERAERLFHDALEINPDNIGVGFEYYDVLVARGKLDEAAQVLDKVEKQAHVVAFEGYRDRVLTARADLALRRGDRQKAIVSLRNALQVNPALDATVRLALTSVLASEGELGQAEELVRTLWSVRRPKDLAAPKDEQEKLGQDVRFCKEEHAARAALALGTFLIQRGAVDEAALVLSEGCERDPEDVDVALTLGTAEIARGRFDAALEVAKKLDAKKLQGAAHIVRGRIALAKNEKEAARKEFDDAASCSPGLAGPALAAAQCALEAGDKPAARKHALSIDTKAASMEEKVARCRVLRDADEKKLARDELEPILATSPGNPSAIDLLVRLAMEDGKPELAAKELDALEKRSPGNRTIQRARTVLALWSANAPEAVKLSQESVTGGTDAGSLPILSAALALEGGVGAAVRELERLSERATEDSVRIRARLQAAELYRALGRGDLAVPILEKGVASHPMTKEMRIALGRVLVGLGRHAEAQRTIAPLLDGAGEPVAILLAATAAQGQAKFDAAIALARRIENDPIRGVEAVALMGLAFRSKGDLDGARGAFQRLRELRPSAALGYVGALCDLVARPAEAAAILRKGHDLLDNDTFALDLAIALDLSGEVSDDECVRVARGVWERQRNDASAAYIYAVTLLRRGRTEEASAALLEARVPAELRAALGALSKEDLASFEALLALRRHGFEKESAEVARKLLQRNASNLVIALHASRALAATGDFEQARSVLAEALTSSPRFAPCRLELGFLLQKLPAGKTGALEAFEQGVALTPEDADLQLARGMALSELGRGADAEAAYRAVLKLQPRNPIARNNLAWLLLVAKRHDEALELAEGVVKDVPTSSAALDTLAQVQLAKGDARAALESAQKAVNAATLDAGVRFTLAKTLDVLGRKKDAANQYEVALLLAASFEGRAEAEKRLGELRAKGN